MNAAVATPRVSFEEYLELEEKSDVRHEWCDGVVFAMSRSQEERRIEVYRRDKDGSWSAAEQAVAGGRVTVHGATITVDDVYA